MIALALSLTLVVVLITVLVPLWTFVTVRRSARAIKTLESRVSVLEGELRHVASAPPQPSATVTYAEEPSAPVALPIPEPVSGEAAAPTISREPVVTPPVVESVAPPAARAKVESLESRIGSRWLLYVGVAALVLGLGYFLKYAFDNDWVTPAMRIVVGVVAGVGLSAVGLRFAKVGYTFFGEVLAGGGIAIVYLSIYAAFDFYSLISRPIAFGLLVLISAAAAVLADRRNSHGLALTAVLGAFSTPFLVGGGEDAAVTLFSYDALIVAGTMYLARRRIWPALNLVSFALTVFTFIAWAISYYTPSKYLVAEGFLTLFVAMFLYIRYAARREEQRRSEAIGIVTLVLTLAPILYHLASLTILSDHSVGFLAYLIGTTAAGLVLGGRTSSGGFRLVMWLAAFLPLFWWIETYGRRLGAGPGLLAAVAIYALHLTVQLTRIWSTGDLRGAEVALLHANGLGLLGAASVLLDFDHAVLAPVFSAAIAIWHMAISRVVARSTPGASLHWVAVGSAAAAVAIAQQFEGVWVTIGWGVEATAIVWLALEQRVTWLRLAGIALFGLATYQLLTLLASPVLASHTVVLNRRSGVGAVLIAACYWLASRHRAHSEIGRSQADGWLVAAHVLTLAVVTADINAFWEVRDLGRTGYLARHMMFSIFWAAYAVALVGLGIRLRNKALRYLAILLLGGTILKVFAIDLSSLDRIYRILTFIILGALLLIASFVYQRFQARLEESEA